MFLESSLTPFFLNVRCNRFAHTLPNVYLNYKSNMSVIPITVGITDMFDCIELPREAYII